MCVLVNFIYFYNHPYTHGTYFSRVQLCTLMHGMPCHAMVPREQRSHRIDERGRSADHDPRPGQTADLWTQNAVRTSQLRPNPSADSETARKIGLEICPSKPPAKKSEFSHSVCGDPYSICRRLTAKACLHFWVY